MDAIAISFSGTLVQRLNYRFNHYFHRKFRRRCTGNPEGFSFLDATVTLRGPVKSEADKEAVTAKVKEVLGSETFDNQIEVKAENTK